MTRHSSLARSAVISAAILAAASLALVGCTAGTPSSSSTNTKQLQIAYMSFAVANSYDAPMLAAAQAEAADNNATLTVFDANNDPQAQFTQLQNAIQSGKYQGIITQPILGTGLVSLVQQAIAKKIKVVNIDQILGANLSTDKPQVKGLSANVTFVPSTIGKQLGEQVVAACAAKNLNPCDVGFLYDIKASSLDVARPLSTQPAARRRSRSWRRDRTSSLPPSGSPQCRTCCSRIPTSTSSREVTRV
jgi:ribose transport system substrate-binding protein